jgi:hypothetical protein
MFATTLVSIAEAREEFHKSESCSIETEELLYGYDFSHLPVNPIELLLQEKQLRGLNDLDSDIGQESTHSFGSSSYRCL